MPQETSRISNFHHRTARSMIITAARIEEEEPILAAALYRKASVKLEKVLRQRDAELRELRLSTKVDATTLEPVTSHQ